MNTNMFLVGGFVLVLVIVGTAIFIWYDQKKQDNSSEGQSASSKSSTKSVATKFKQNSFFDPQWTLGLPDGCWAVHEVYSDLQQWYHLDLDMYFSSNGAQQDWVWHNEEDTVSVDNTTVPPTTNVTMGFASYLQHIVDKFNLSYNLSVDQLSGCNCIDNQYCQPFNNGNCFGHASWTSTADQSFSGYGCTDVIASDTLTTFDTQPTITQINQDPSGMYYGMHQSCLSTSNMTTSPNQGWTTYVRQ